MFGVGGVVGMGRVFVRVLVVGALVMRLLVVGIASAGASGTAAADASIAADTGMSGCASRCAWAFVLA